MFGWALARGPSGRMDNLKAGDEVGQLGVGVGGGVVRPSENGACSNGGGAGRGGASFKAGPSCSCREGEASRGQCRGQGDQREKCLRGALTHEVACCQCGCDHDVGPWASCSDLDGCVLTWMLCPPPPALQVILSVAEHHSNLVPWQMVAQKTGAVLKHVRLTPDTQELDMQVRGDTEGWLHRTAGQHA
jgi:hypothetical protein